MEVCSITSNVVQQCIGPGTITLNGLGTIPTCGPDLDTYWIMTD